MKQQVALLNEASKAYYQEDKQIMTDFEYDKLYDELAQMEKETGIVLANSPTQKVGYTVLSNLTKIQHDSKILSLDKTKESQKLKDWLEDKEGILSWKLDGLTIVLKYNGGNLVQAITRGNGEVGEDITHNARVFKNIPLKINFKKELILRGEGIISYSEFKKINEQLEEQVRLTNKEKQVSKEKPARKKILINKEKLKRPLVRQRKKSENSKNKKRRQVYKKRPLVRPKKRVKQVMPIKNEFYKNPRNLCSGTVRQLNSEIAAKRNVLFYAFTLVNAEGKQFDDLKSNQLTWLEQLGFDVVEHVLVNTHTVTEQVQKFQEKIVSNDFASDGLVLTYNSISYSQSLGVTSKFPKDSIAFKWADETAETSLLEIEWNTSRTGLMNPIAIFEPVELEGTTVNRASVHNVSILEDLKLGLGDRIEVYKANMIIPQIAENLTRSGTAEIPKHCFVCHGETEIRMLKEGKALYCTNPNCKAQQIMSFKHFVSRDAMNIEGLSEETLKKFVEKGFIQYYTDIFDLKKYEEEIKNMEGFGEKSYQNLIDSIEKSKTVSLPSFIYALGMNHVGLSNAKLLCKYFKYDIEKIMIASEEDLIDIDGFGEVIAHSIYQYFHDKKDLVLFKKALQMIKLELPKEKELEQLPLEKIQFVITGDLEFFENRKQLQEKIEVLGGKVTASVTKKTSYLINNDTLSKSSKNKKAQQLNIPILTEKQFIQQFMQEQ